MPDKYGCWSKNPCITSNNGTTNWSIFKNFPNDVKVWYYVVVDVGQKELFFFLRAIPPLKMMFDNHPKFFNTFAKSVSISFLENF